MLKRLYLNPQVKISTFLFFFFSSSQVRLGQFSRRLWGSTRRISQVSSGETEYNPTENADK